MSHKKDARLMWVKDLGLTKLFLKEELDLSLEIKIILFLFRVRLVYFNNIKTGARNYDASSKLRKT